MSQILRPASDIYNYWTCSAGTSAYALIDEVTSDDADYITANSNGNEVEVKLSSGGIPVNRDNHIITYRFKNLTTPGYLDFLYVQLLCGSTEIIVSPINQYGGVTSFTDFTLALTNEQASAITDYSDLRLRFTRSSTSRVQAISQAFLTIPDAQNNIGLEMGCNF